MVRTSVFIIVLFALISTRTDAQLQGAGATFPAPLYQKWIASFQERYPGMVIQYDGVGSGDGLQRLKDGQVDFAASDILPDADAVSHPFPSVVGAVVPVYNLPELRQDLRFSPDVLADIYLGKIRKWNHPKLQSLNHQLTLPDKAIVVVHRSDSSGTTYVLSSFLSKTDNEWKSTLGVGSTLPWSVGEGVIGNEGAATKVKQTEGSIGYVEFIYAVRQHLSFGSVRNADGKFVRADIDSVTAAARTAKPSDNFRISIINPPGPDVYPIASFTWLLVSPTPPSEKRERLMNFLSWALSTGQRQAAALGYVPLPDELAQQERTALAAMNSR